MGEGDIVPASAHLARFPKHQMDLLHSVCRAALPSDHVQSCAPLDLYVAPTILHWPRVSQRLVDAAGAEPEAKMLTRGKVET